MHPHVGQEHDDRPDVGCHVVSHVRANMEGFFVVGEQDVNGRIPQLSRHRPYEGQHVLRLGVANTKCMRLSSSTDNALIGVQLHLHTRM